MINKQNLWFLTLFSLILVLSIYYFTLSDDTLSVLKEETVDNSAATIEIEESNALASMKVANEEEVLAKMEEYQNILLDEKSSSEEKNDAYDNLKQLNNNKGKEEEIDKKIKQTYNLDSFTKIKDNQINVVVSSDKHDNEIANNIIRTVQELFENKMYITVKFEK
ncbi:MAG: SpoIIIAH-like family protein [Bacilli bacterium]|nr:SpoIIIAH-like family protein [Bacilli bacterium]